MLLQIGNNDSGLVIALSSTIKHTKFFKYILKDLAGKYR